MKSILNNELETSGRAEAHEAGGHAAKDEKKFQLPVPE